MAARECVVCGKAFEAQRSSAKYCGSGCRARASQGAGLVKLPPKSAAEPDLVSVTRRTLDSAGVLDSVDGQAALVLASRMVQAHETGAAVASLSKQLQAVMGSALSVKAAADPLDELRRRRDSKRAG